ncbi:MAG: SLBB domain-containing protein [Ignavibacteriales bacterium]|nr:SLBB domain-containing protein [Ignavibacteriales bacterium]
MRIFQWLVFCCFLFLSSSVFSQTEAEKENLINKAQQGIVTKLSPEQLQVKLKELGLSEEEARRKAKERGLNFEDFIRGVKAEAPGRITKPPKEEQVGQVSELANALRDTVPSPKGLQDLDYFGYDIFKHIPAAFEPNAVGPVDPGYLLGVGDVVRLTVWGQAEFQYELDVDREGRVFIPNVGQVFALGTPLNKLQQKFRLVLSKYYSGLATNPPTAFLDVTIAKLKPLRVFVMGEVKQPGGYTISSYATVFNALYAIGGPLTKGTLRTIKVLRENEVVAVVDLYDYLLRGDKSSDVRLQNNDVIFVPPRGKTVSIRGEIRRPAIYELKGNEDLRTLVGYAGGLLATAYVDNAQIDRVRPFESRAKNVDDRFIVDLNLGQVMKNGGKEAMLYDADEMQVFSILDEKKNYVTIRGSVWRPGRFELGSINTIRELIKAAEGVLPKTYLERAHLIRLNEDRITTTMIPFNLGKLLNDAASDMKLAPKDSVIIYGSEVVEVKNKSVAIYGHVKKPGIYILRDRMSLADFILQAGGYTEDVDLLQAEISRVRPDGLHGDSLAIIHHLKLSNDFVITSANENLSPTKSLRNMSPDQFILHHRDQVFIRPNPDYKLQQNVTIEGDFTYPGVYAIKQRGEHISEILERAGGPTKTTYLDGAQYLRKGVRLIVDLEKAYYKKDRDNDIIVSNGDSIVFNPRPRTVLVSGQVNKPGLFSFIEGDNASDYIDRAGGRTDSASYTLLISPTGETKRVNFGLFSANPKVLDGSAINVLRMPPEVSEEKKVDWSSTIKDAFAIIASATTVIYLISQVK